MKRIFINGLSGGTGASSVAANLAAGLQSLGQRTLTVELNPANTLGIHYGVSPAFDQGWALAFCSDNAMEEAAYRSADSRLILPFGKLSRDAYRHYLSQHSEALLRLSTNLANVANIDYLIFDGPSLASTYCESHAPAEHSPLRTTDSLSLCVIRPSAECYSLLQGEESPRDHRQLLLLNQVQAQAQLSQDLSLIMRTEYDQQLVPLTLNCDEAIPEAAASLCSVLEHSTHSQAASDFRALAYWCRNRWSP